DEDLALALGDVAVFHRAIDLADDGGFAGLAGLEELDHAGEAAGDVLGLGGFAGDFGDDVAGGDGGAVLDHQVGMGGHEVLAGVLGSPLAVGGDQHLGLALLVGGLGDDPVGEAGDIVD